MKGQPMKKLLIVLVVFVSNISYSFSPPISVLTGNDTISVCSFNIQFLGQSPDRDNESLTEILKDFDIVVVQEVLAPPYDGTFPDGTNYDPDEQVTDFFDKMQNNGFEFILSPEDTGPGATNHKNSNATEWWAAFYKPEKLKTADDLPNGFLDEDRTDNEYYERVPYAFAFRTLDEKMDFDLISVHLKPDDSSEDKARRKEELSAIRDWIDDNDDTEKDFIILGDMNITGYDELRDATPGGFKSLNDECRATNTNVNGPKPYDHVMYRSRFTKEVDKHFDFRVYNLIEAMRPFWEFDEPYPGGLVNPIEKPEYNHNEFRKYYSDHDPVVFRMIVPDQDDD
jgi:endonuclease/exonuclease/phosphatase family metal-dependent hydrolase